MGSLAMSSASREGEAKLWIRPIGEIANQEAARRQIEEILLASAAPRSGASALPRAAFLERWLDPYFRDHTAALLLATYGDPDVHDSGYLMILDADGTVLHDVPLPNPGHNGNGNGASADGGTAADSGIRSVPGNWPGGHGCRLSSPANDSTF